MEGVNSTREIMNFCLFVFLDYSKINKELFKEFWEAEKINQLDFGDDVQQHIKMELCNDIVTITLLE